MDCTYYKKVGLVKRLSGVKGYCSYHGMYIKQHKKTNYPPYFNCKGMDNNEFNNCSIQVRMSGR